MNRFALTALAAAFAFTALAPTPAEAVPSISFKKRLKKLKKRARQQAELRAAAADEEVEAIAEEEGVDLDTPPPADEPPAAEPPAAEPPAAEPPAAEPPAAEPPADGVYTVCAAGCDFTSIQDAIDGTDDGDHIRLDGGVYDENVVIDRPVVLYSAVNATLRGDGESPVLTVTVDGVAHINGIGISSGGGLAGVINYGVMSLDMVVLSNHDADFGALLNAGDLTMSHTTVLSNRGEYLAGGVTNYATAVIETSSFSANEGYLGGGLANSNGTATVIDSSFSTNYATSIGGAWSNHNLGGTVTMDGVGFAANTTGAGVYTTCYDVNGQDGDCPE